MMLYSSISQWISIDSAQTSILYQICSHSVGIRVKFCSCPPLLTFQLSEPTTFIDHHLSADCQWKSSSDICSCSCHILCSWAFHISDYHTQWMGVVLWWNGNCMSKHSSFEACWIHLNNISFNMQYCRGGPACMAIYACVWSSNYVLVIIQAGLLSIKTSWSCFHFRVYDIMLPIYQIWTCTCHAMWWPSPKVTAVVCMGHAVMCRGMQSMHGECNGVQWCAVVCRGVHGACSGM